MDSIFRIIILAFILVTAIPETGQCQTPEILKLRNKSFDALNKHFVIPPAWYPQILFLGVKSPKELRLTRFYREEEKSQKGNNHVALSTYFNGTRENIGQKLKYPIIQGHTYKMDIWLAWSPNRTTIHPIQQLHSGERDLRPVKLQVYGFHSAEDYSNSLLAETAVVDHTDWKKYTLSWESPGKYQYIYLVATWNGEEYYNGNILLDNISDIHVSMSGTKRK